MFGLHTLQSHTRQLGRYFESAAWEPWKIKRSFRRAAAADCDIVVGPWVSEVGFELLYWVPMLRRLLRTYDIAPRRVVALSRGGVADWYRGLADRYIEIFDLISPAEFHERNVAREHRAGTKKQMGNSDLDRFLLQAACERHGLQASVVLHPSLMYRLMRGFWRGRFPWAWVRQYCDFSALPEPHGGHVELPFRGPYYTAKFYFSSCFPDTLDNRRLVTRVLETLARHRPVVLLGTGLQVDDHADWTGCRPHNVFDAQPLFSAANNLAQQTALVAGSEGLYCTYGGFSYLGPLLGCPVVSLYSEMNFVPAHLQLAEIVFNGDEHGRFAALPAAAYRRWLETLAPAEAVTTLPTGQAA